MITLGSVLGCPVAGSHPRKPGSGVGSSHCSPALSQQPWLPLPPPRARKSPLCLLCRPRTTGSFQEKISNANSNYIVGLLGPWGDLGSCLVGATWLNLAVSFCSIDEPRRPLMLEGTWDSFWVTIQSVQDEESNILIPSDTWPIFFSSGWKDFKYYPKPPATCQKILLSPGIIEQNQTLTKLLNLLSALGFTTIALTQVLRLDLCSTEPSITTTRN